MNELADSAKSFTSDMLAKSLLDESQKAFCSYPSNMLRLLAPAGSGKTLSLLWRCLNDYLCSKDNNRRYLVFTFTRAARQELRERLYTDTDFSRIRNAVEVNTLNSWGYRRLKTRAFKLKLCTSKSDRYFCITNLLQPVWRQHERIEYVLNNHKATAHQSIMEMIDSIKSLGFRHDIHILESQFRQHVRWLVQIGMGSRMSLMVHNAADLELVDIGVDNDQMLNQFYEHFMRFWIDACLQMRKSDMFTLEDQKYWTLIELENNSAEGRFTTGNQRYHHILVDEFQDINTLDLNLLKAISTVNKASLTIVGDDDQAIYEWRGATPQFILDPDTHIAHGYHTITLDTNYRSPRNIVELSQQLIKNNSSRVKKHVRAFSDKDAVIEVWNVPSINDSIDYVLREVRHMLSSPDIKSVGIIGRKRSQIIPYQIVFASENIRFYAAEDLQVLLSDAFTGLKQLLLIKARADERQGKSEAIEDFLKLCNVVKRYPLSKSDSYNVRSFLWRGNIGSVLEVLGTFCSYTGSLKGKNEFGKMTLDYAKAITYFLACDTVSSSIDCLSVKFQGLQKDYGRSLEDIFYADPPFLHLSDYARRYGSDYVAFTDDVEKAVDTLAIVPPEYEEDILDDATQLPLHLMTALRAKGKEYDAVVMLDVNNGIWPSVLAKTPDELEQERRMFYVAFTRARKRLILLCNKEILGEPTLPSLYLEEMGLSPVAM